MRIVLAAVALALGSALLGCSSPQPSRPAGLTDSARDASFGLEIATSADRYQAGDAIPITTTIAYLGPDERTTARSAYQSLVYFGLEQLDGPLDMPGGFNRLMCYSADLVRGQPVDVAYGKSGAWTGEDPNAAFWQAFFADKQLRLPAGTWRVTATLATMTPDCRGPLDSVDASVTFRVDQ